MKNVNLTPEQIQSTFQVGAPAHPRCVRRHSLQHPQRVSTAGAFSAADPRPRGAPSCGTAPRMIVTRAHDRDMPAHDRDMPARWQAIDLDGNGEISQIEFIKALRRDPQLGFHGCCVLPSA